MAKARDDRDEALEAALAALDAVEKAAAELRAAQVEVRAKEQALAKARKLEFELRMSVYGRTKTPLIEYAERNGKGKFNPDPEPADDQAEPPAVIRGGANYAAEPAPDPTPESGVATEADVKAALKGIEERAGRAAPVPAANLCALHPGTWQDVPTRDVFLGAEVRNEMKARGYTTLGALASAATFDGLYEILDKDFTRTEIVSIEHDLAAWLRKYPEGFPSDLAAKFTADLDASYPSSATKPPSLADGSTIAEIVAHDQSARKAKRTRKPKPTAAAAE